MFAADNSRIKVWPEGEGLSAGIMLQMVVDDADALAALARQNGLQPRGPLEARGERIDSLLAPGGLAMTFQSPISASADQD